MKGDLNARSFQLRIDGSMHPSQSNLQVKEGNPDEASVDLLLLEQISPVGWDNVLLYGKYVLDQDLVQT